VAEMFRPTLLQHAPHLLQFLLPYLKETTNNSISATSKLFVKSRPSTDQRAVDACLKKINNSNKSIFWGVKNRLRCHLKSENFDF